MYLRDLIERLSNVPPETIVPIGFHRPHSYRGTYSELAFEPKRNATAGEMLEAARSALGATYIGYKGGEYTMGEYTPVHLAYYGSTGEEIGAVLFAYMFNWFDDVVRE